MPQSEWAILLDRRTGGVEWWCLWSLFPFCVYLKNHQSRVGFPIVLVLKCASPLIPDAVATFLPPVPVARPSGALFTGRTMASAV